MTPTRLLVAVLFLATLLSIAAPALAHARLVSSAPTGGSTVAEAPSEVVL